MSWAKNPSSWFSLDKPKVSLERKKEKSKGDRNSPPKGESIPIFLLLILFPRVKYFSVRNPAHIPSKTRVHWVTYEVSTLL